MAANVRYLTKREGMYRYERWIPDALQPALGGKKLFRKSLRTKHQSEALERVGGAEAEYDALIASVGGATAPAAAMPLVAVRQLRSVTQADLDMIEQHRRRSELRPWEQLYLAADASPEHAELLDEQTEIAGLMAEDRNKAITQPGFDDPSKTWLPSPVADARDLVGRLGLDAAPGTPAFGAVVSAVRRGYLAGAHDVDDLLAGRLKPVVQDAPQASVGTIAEVMAGYLAFKKLPPKSVSECNLALKQFTEIAGDKPLEAIVKGDFIKLVRTLAGKVVGGNSAGSVARPMSSKSIKKRVGFLRAAINFAIDSDNGFEGPNPASSINYDVLVPASDPYITPAKRPFEIGELNKLFQHPWFTGCASATNIHKPGSHRLDGSEFWAPVVALFTGCRASELGGLRLAEIKLDDAYPHFVIRDNEYRGTKSGYERCVPILDELLALGFAEYVGRVASAGADRLFPDWESPKRTGDFDRDDAAWSNAKIIRAFNRTVIPAVFKGDFVEGARRPVTFHSLRGSFKSMLTHDDRNINVNVINEVIGHSKSELDQSYVGTIPISKTHPAIRSCRYEGLTLPTAKK